MRCKILMVSSIYTSAVTTAVFAWNFLDGYAGDQYDRFGRAQMVSRRLQEDHYPLIKFPLTKQIS